MSRVAKYIHFTDTEIDGLITNFINMLCLVDSDIFYKYLTDFHAYDLTKKEYNKRKLIIFIATIVDFIDKKQNKLRIRDDLKLNKNQVLAIIFGDIDISEFDDSLKYYMALLLDFYLSEYDIFEHIEKMEENYVAMYDEYLRNYDLNNN